MPVKLGLNLTNLTHTLLGENSNDDREGNFKSFLPSLSNQLLSLYTTMTLDIKLNATINQIIITIIIRRLPC